MVVARSNSDSGTPLDSAPMEPRQLLRIADAARLVKATEVTIRAWITKEFLVPYELDRMPGVLLVDKEELLLVSELRGRDLDGG